MKTDRQGEPLDDLRPDELSDEQLESVALRYQLVCLMEKGVSAEDALKRLGIAKTPRWARKIRQRFQEDGIRGLLDGRKANSRSTTVLTTEVSRLILQWWAARPAAGPKAIWRKVRDECKHQGLPAPAYQTVWEYLNALPEPLKAAREGKITAWDKQGRPVVRFDLASFANERFQLDHTQLDIWVREWAGDHWEVRQVWCTAALDEFSRSIAGVVVSTKHPDAWTISILLMQAVMPKRQEGWRNRGLPQVVQPDRGRDFMSNAVQTVFAQLGVRFDPDPPYYPNRKGKVERWFLTLDRGCLRILPGHKEAVGRSEGAAQKRIHTLLTREQLLREIEQWVATDYHQRTHSETERKPAELWEETVRLRMPDSEEVFHGLLLKADQTRVVRNTGIDFLGNRYWAPDLVERVRTEVVVRYNPEDLESILVYDATTGEKIGEAFAMTGPDPRYTIHDVKRERRLHRRGILSRIQEYRKEIEEHDRRVAREAAWDHARELRDEWEEMDVEAEEPEEVDDLEDILEIFRRQDRGEL